MRVISTPDPIHALLPPTIFGIASSPKRSRPATLPDPKAKLKHGVAGPSHWSTFWRDFGVDDKPLERCFIPGDGQHIVDRHWEDFAAALPQAAQVVDLGCGAGILGRTILAHRRDVQVTGVDFSQVPAISYPGLTIESGVGMESLPFEDGCFDAAVSLFGIEYGNIAETADELCRVLKPGARFAFVVHHHLSEIVREGTTRRRGLRELLSGKMRTAFLAGAAGRFDEQYQRLQTEFPREPSVKLFSDHFRHNIGRTQGERQELWQKLAHALDPEMTLTLHMERSAKSPEQLGAWLVPLLSSMASVDVCVLRRRSGEPIAWSVSGER